MRIAISKFVYVLKNVSACFCMCILLHVHWIFMCRPIGTHLTACVAMGIPRDVFNASVLGYQSLSTEKCFCMCNWDIHA